MRFKHPSMMTASDCVRYAEIALDHDSPDTRREAVVHLGRSRCRSNDTVVRALGAVALNDSSQSVRHAATLALAEAGTPESLEPLLDIVAADRGPSGAAGPSAEVRYSAMQGLDGFLVRGALSEEQRRRSGDAAQRLILNSPSRDVRIASALLLRHFPERPSADALIEGLEQRDFGVVYESHRSLVRLTGQRLSHDPDAWRAWLASAGDPFAGLGTLDAELYPPEKSFWQKRRESAQRLFAGFRPKNDAAPPAGQPAGAVADR